VYVSPLEKFSGVKACVNLSNKGTPPVPGWLYLGRGHASVSKPMEINSGKFTFNISYRFFIGNHGYYWSWIACAKDSESTDGLGLPGTHGCGAKRVSDSFAYLG